jgi:hypothetical protein
MARLFIGSATGIEEAESILQSLIGAQCLEVKEAESASIYAQASII